MIKATGTGEIVIKFKYSEKCEREALQTKEEGKKAAEQYLQEIFKGMFDEFQVEVRNLEFEVEEL